MPVITISMGTGQADGQQKKHLIEDFTSQAVKIMNLPPQSFIVLINELEHDSVGVGGQTLKEVIARR